jgi:trigger factor
MAAEKEYIIDKISLKKGKALERILTVTLPYHYIDGVIESRMTSLGKKAKLKGFRPGKIPRSVLKQYYSEQVKFESEEEVVRETLSKAFKKEEVIPVGTPSIASMDKKSESFTYVIEFEVYPDIKLKEFRKIKVKDVNSSIEEKNIDTMLDRLKDQKALWTIVDRAANDNDRIKIDFEGKIEEEAFEGGKAENASMELGQGQLIKDFEDGLKGLKKGDTSVINVAFPKDYPTQDLQGKEAVFEVKCHEVEEKILPEIDAEFLESVGFKDRTLQELKEEIEVNLNKEFDVNLLRVRKKRIFDALLESSKFDIPQVLIKEESEYLAREFRSRQGMKEEDELPQGIDFDANAKDRVGLSLILQQIIKERDVKLDEQRVEARLDQMVATYPNADEMKRNYRSHQESMQQLGSQIIEEQIVDLVLSEAKVVMEKVSFDELLKL